MTTQSDENRHILEYFIALLESDNYKRQAQTVFLLACSPHSIEDPLATKLWEVYSMDVLHRLNGAMMTSRMKVGREELDAQYKALQEADLGLQDDDFRFFDGYLLRRLIHNRLGLPKAWEFASEQFIKEILNLLDNPALSIVEWKLLASLTPCAKVLLMAPKDQINELWRIIDKNSIDYLRSLALAILTVTLATERSNPLDEHIDLLFKNADGIALDAVAWVLPFVLQNDDEKLTISVQPFLNDNSHGVRYRTMIALARIGTPTAINMLVQVLYNGIQEARAQAASALGHSRKSELVLNELFKAASLENSPETRKAIAEAIVEVNLPEQFSEQLTLDELRAIINIREMCKSKNFDEGIDAVDTSLGRIRSLSPKDFDESWKSIVDYPQSPRLLSECEEHARFAAIIRKRNV